MDRKDVNNGTGETVTWNEVELLSWFRREKEVVL